MIKMNKKELVKLLNSEGNKQKNLFEKARDITNNSVSKKIYFRSLIEFSNICKNDCFYCGIRKSNTNVKRYLMTEDEVLESADWSYKAGFRSMVLQSGEQKNKNFVDYVCSVTSKIKNKYPDVGITLCVGEQTKKNYQRFFDAGAHRYLLRIESSCPEHYKKLHPKSMSHDKRKKCLSCLKEIGFQTGTGVLIGTPYQSLENLADDLLFFKEIDIDMVGMGPYVFHKDTPFAKDFPELNSSEQNKYRLDLGLNMIASLRLLMPKINIASTTALQALDTSYGRSLGISAGANVVMPLITPEKYREYYKLYDEKPFIDESSETILENIKKEVKSLGLEPRISEWGDSLHYYNRGGK